jgi:hypothetical protein
MTRPPRWRGWAAILAALVLIARRGHADDAGSKAETLIQRGVELRRAGQNGEALAQFQSAYALVPTPRAEAQIALALQALGDWLGAEIALQTALRSADDPWIAQYREALDGALATVRAHLASLHIDVNVTEGQLLLDGVSVHLLPTADAVRIRAGTLDIEVRAPGYVPAHRKVDVAAGAEVRESFSLDPIARPLPPAPTDAAPVAHPQPVASRDRVGSYVAFASSVALAGGGVVAWRVHEGELAHYNDDTACVFGTLTRSQRCGGYDTVANVALGLEIGAFAASAITVGVGAWLLWSPSRHRPETAGASCGPYGAFGVACGGRF